MNKKCISAVNNAAYEKIIAPFFNNHVSKCSKSVRVLGLKLAQRSVDAQRIGSTPGPDGNSRCARPTLTYFLLKFEILSNQVYYFDSINLETDQIILIKTKL